MTPHSLDDILGEDSGPTTASTKLVPNVFPTITAPYRLAIIGEAPGSDEVSEGKPFVGTSGRELDKYLSKVGILRDACFVGNICQHQPERNNIANFDWHGKEIKDGLKQLSNDLQNFQPNMVLCLGGSALHAFAWGMSTAPPKRKTTEGLRFVYPMSIGDWRGSLLLSSSDSPLPMTKMVASYHPAAALRNFEWMPLILFDLMFKVCKEYKTKELVLPERHLKVNLTFEETVAELEKVLLEKPKVALDIEGGVGTMSCVSFATSPSSAFIVPFVKRNGENFWTHPSEETTIWRLVAAICTDEKIKKILQNSLYDRFVLHYSYGIVMRGVVDDTMLKHWELYCEFPKDLGFLNSLYTRQPYYKGDIKATDAETFWRYCCMDSATTYEISEALENFLPPAGKRHYHFNIDLLNPLLRIQLHGLKYDKERAKARLKETETHIFDCQFQLDQLTGRGLKLGSTKMELFAITQQSLCQVRDKSKPYAGSETSYKLIVELLNDIGDLKSSELGFISTELGLSLNVRSKAFKDFLYKEKGFKPQYKPRTKTLTSDFDALLRLKKLYPAEKVLDYALDIGLHRTRAQYLSIIPDKDNRMRWSNNLVGSETGRVTSSRSNVSVGKKRVGANMQTISDDWELEAEELELLTEGLRSLLLADEGCYLYKCDLKGADGWTIGAHMAALGDTTMLEDLKAGVKPAQVVCYILRHGYSNLINKTRNEIKELCKEVKKEDWDYYVCKQGIWGTCYLMGPRKLADIVFKESYGKVNLSEKQARDFQGAVFARYRVRLWHQATERLIKSQPYPPKLTSPSGHSRYFFERYTDVLGKWLAHEPQSNTTYVINVACHNCWFDPENRVGKTLRLEPMHQVHDELLMQGCIEDHAWNVAKIKQWFDNKIVIAGIPITIPFDGAYGTDWSMSETSKVGVI